MPILNGALECELREYIIFEGDYKGFRAEGGSIRSEAKHAEKRTMRRESDREWTDRARRGGMGGKFARTDRKAPARDGGFRKERSDFKAPRRDAERPSSENPLAVRRNEQALKMLVGRRPQLPPADGNVTMRPRKGWKRPDSDTSNSNN